MRFKKTFIVLSLLTSIAAYAQDWQCVGPNRFPLKHPYPNYGGVIGIATDAGNGPVFNLRVDPDNAQNVYAYNGTAGIWRSMAGNNLWEAKNNGLPVVPSEFKFQIMRKYSNNLFAVPISNYDYVNYKCTWGIYRSNNRGDSWSKINYSNIPTNYPNYGTNWDVTTFDIAPHQTNEDYYTLLCSEKKSVSHPQNGYDNLIISKLVHHDGQANVTIGLITNFPNSSNTGFDEESHYFKEIISHPNNSNAVYKKFYILVEYLNKNIGIGV